MEKAFHRNRKWMWIGWLIMSGAYFQLPFIAAERLHNPLFLLIPMILVPFFYWMIPEIIVFIKYHQKQLSSL